MGQSNNQKSNNYGREKTTGFHFKRDSYKRLAQFIVTAVSAWFIVRLLIGLSYSIFYQPDVTDEALFDWYHSTYLHLIDLGVLAVLGVSFFEALFHYKNMKVSIAWLVVCVLIVAGYYEFDRRFAYEMIGLPDRIPHRFCDWPTELKALSYELQKRS